MVDTLRRSRELWERDPAQSVLYVRMHRSELPDLTRRVAARNALFAQQAEQLRNARDVHDRVNTTMQMLGGAAQPMPSFGMAQVDLGEHLFETVVATVTIDVPAAAAHPGPHGTLMEDVLLDRALGADLWAALLPPQHRAHAAALELSAGTLRMLGPSMESAARLVEALPRLIAAVSIPDHRVAPIAERLGVR